MAFDCPKCGSRTKFKVPVCGSCGRVDPLEFQKLYGYLPQSDTAPGDIPGSNQPFEKIRSDWVLQKVSGIFGLLKDKSFRKRSQVECPADPGPIPTGTTPSIKSESRLHALSTSESKEPSEKKRSVMRSEVEDTAASRHVFGKKKIQTSPAPKTEANEGFEETVDDGSQSLSTRPKAVVPPPLLPTQTAQTSARTDPEVNMNYPGNLHRQGYTRPKVFSTGVCGRCQGPHETLDHQWCHNCFEVFKRKGDGKSRCEKKDCSHPIGHSTEDCGLGEFRDHPDNPRLPRHLADFRRPWDPDSSKQPLPMYYYRPRGREVPEGCPELPPKYQEEGLPGGLVNASQGMLYSVENAIHKGDGQWRRLQWDPQRHGKDIARKPRWEMPHRGGPPRWEQENWRRQAPA
ncbi:hypothetical protein LTR67_005168 [Exophiala xenobiotica]